VATAIPAFIGYTEIAEYKGNSLTNVPTRITSMLDYRDRFGGDPRPGTQGITIDLDSSNIPANVTIDYKYFLYNCLQTFFGNGGGNCYIISIGGFDDEIKLAAFETGLAALKKYDEPTMIVFTDAVNLSSIHLGTLQARALEQSAELGDRVVVMDVKETGEFETDVVEFRSRLGINNLKYGAAYAPYLRTTLVHEFRFEDVKLKKAGVTKTFLTVDNDVAKLDSSLTLLGNISDTNVIALRTEIETIANAVLKLAVAADITTEKGKYTPLSEQLDTLLKKIQAVTKDPEKQATTDSIAALAAFIVSINTTPRVLATIETDLAALKTKLKPIEDIESEVIRLNPKMPVLNTLRALDVANSYLFKLTSKNVRRDRVDLNVALQTIIRKLNATQSVNVEKSALSSILGTLKNQIKDAADAAKSKKTSIQTAAAAVETARSKITTELEKATPNITELLAGQAAFVTEMVNLEAALGSVENEIRSLEAALSNLSLLYANVVRAIEAHGTTLPPSAAIAGVYTAVDSDRGVWKAPANVSLNYVIAPSVLMDNYGQEDLNVDVNGGKSINAIRSFVNKGTLVWGARTLAGNDNEWRYISVRRFFNMVEESVKKSTEWAVFEPNDAKTWGKVKGMIENYLYQKWMDGALAGAKFDDAYFVKIGLGLTMTAQDILEGRMIVEIGMAVVRPAEFIILKFSHKLQRS
jgi:uncharacterized protein